MEEQIVSLYGDLTVVELTEIILMFRALISTDMAINFSIYFGYLVVTYVVGRRLTRLQAVTFSTAYSVLVLAAIYQIYADLTVINVLRGILTGASVPAGYSLFQVSVLLVMWCLTIVYMYQQRRRADEP
jgi:hypothetical protein